MSYLLDTEKIAIEKGIRVIVCIDEFQQLANISHWERLEAMLRSEWQLQHHTTYCLYGSKYFKPATLKG